MKEIVPHIDVATLLILDVDNTVLEPEGNLGSDQWYYYLVRKYKDIDGLGEKAAEKKALAVWNKVQKTIKVRAVEKDSPAIIKEQQKRGIKVLGFTARSPEIADLTLRQLQLIGVDYSTHPLHDKDFEFKVDGEAKYTQGVLFVGEDNDKGKALVHFLKAIAFDKNKIVFVDDKLKNVESVAKALKPLGIGFICFRYAATDAKVQQFKADTKDIQLYFSGVVTPQAEEGLKKAPDDRKKGWE